jgi:hypothetical protein
MGKFKKGGPGGPGRRPGQPNKSTAVIKEAITAVYEKLQEGTEEAHGHFLDWAKANPSEFYKLAAKLIPIQVGGPDDGPIVHEIRRTIVRPKA